MPGREHGGRSTTTAGADHVDEPRVAFVVTASCDVFPFGRCGARCLRASNSIGNGAQGEERPARTVRTRPLPRCDGRLLYVLDAGNDEVRAFRRLGNGALLPLGTLWSLDDGAAGLLAR